MLGRRIDLPLASDPSTRLLPWLIGVMVFVAVLMLLGGLVLARTASEWDRGLRGTLTVEVPPKAAETEPEMETRLETARRAVLNTPGVAEARIVPVSELAAALEPWLGAQGAALDLPLPRLIDVSLAARDSADLALLKRNLKAAVADAVVDDHGLWRRQVQNAAMALEYLALAIVGLVALSAVLSVVFAVRSGIAVHRDVIELLHLMGAQDSYIAGQFQGHVFRLALIGGVIGAVLAGASALALKGRLAELDVVLLADVGLGFWSLLAAALIPLGLAVVASWTTRRTVLRALRRLQG